MKNNSKDLEIKDVMIKLSGKMLRNGVSASIGSLVELCSRLFFSESL